MKPKGEIPKSTRNRTPDQEMMIHRVRTYQAYTEIKTAITLRFHAMRRNELITEEDEKEGIAMFKAPFAALQRQEIKGAKQLLEDLKVWTEWLQHVRGVGDILAVQLIAHLSPISDFDTVSKVWAWCGYHTVEGKDGVWLAARRTAGQKCTWGNAIKVLCFQLGQSFVKQTKPTPSPYRAMYDHAKADYRLKHPEKVARPGKKDGETVYDFTDGHIDKMAMRIPVKMFLSHLWQVWREFEGLHVRGPYAIEKMGHTTLISPWSCIENQDAVVAATG
jgi:hypothetical protein